MNIRKATKRDVPYIVEMIADDPLGSQREQNEHPLPQLYYDAFENIDSDPNQELIVAESEDGIVIGTLQVSFIQYLTYKGGIRAQIEGVRIHKDHRGHGLGEDLFKWAIQRAKDRGAHLVQLTSDKKRPDAIKFYDNLGFVASHEGFKLHLKSS